MIELLPSAWVDAPLGVLVNLIRGVTFPASSKVHEPADDVVACLRTSHIQEKLRWDNIYFIPRHFVRREDQFTRRNDILMSMANSSNLVGKVCINESDDSACFGAFLAAIRCNEISHKYIYYFLRSNAAQSKLRATASQTVNIANISVGELEKLLVPLPPLAEQKRIAQQLNALLAQVDTLKARIDAMPALLKRFRQSVLAVATSGQLTEEWRSLADSCGPCSAKIGDYVVLMKGGASPSTTDYSNAGTLALNKGDIKEFGVISPKSTPKFLPHQFVSENRSKLISTGSVLVTLRDLSQKSNFLGLVGKYREKADAVITQGMYLIELDRSRLLDEFLMMVSNSPRYRQKVKREKVGATQVHLRNEQFLNLSFLIFSREEQAEIVRRVEQLFAYAEQLEAKVATAKQRIDTLTQSLLAKAFRGELVPQDPNDEPASVLLERIRAQRAAAPKPRRGRKPVSST